MKNCLVRCPEIQSSIKGTLSETKIKDYIPSLIFSGSWIWFFFWNIMRLHFMDNAYHENLKLKWYIQDKNKGNNSITGCQKVKFYDFMRVLIKINHEAIWATHTRQAWEKMSFSKSFDLQVLGHTFSMLIDVRYTWKIGLKMDSHY